MTSYRMANDVDSDNMWIRRSGLEYQARLSCLYHRKREWFFDALDKAIKAIAVISASSALTPLVVGNGTLIVNLVIVTTGTLALVLDFSERARRHSDLAVRFAHVERDIAVVGEQDFTETDLRRFTSSIYEAQTSETAVLRGLAQLCQDEIDASRNVNVPKQNLSLFRRFRAHLGFGTLPYTPRKMIGEAEDAASA